MQRLFGFTCALFLLSGTASADDSSAALGMGGIAFTQSADIRMTDEDLSISPKAVRIRFAFANDSNKDIDTIVAFPLPDIDTGMFWGSPLGTVTDDPVNFVGFSVKADGEPVQISVEQRAFLKERDVTGIVKAAGLPINIAIGKGNDLLMALPAAKRKILTAAGLAEFDDADHNAIPLWTARTKFYWRQHFPARKTVVLEQAYQPVTGQFFFGGASFEQDDASDQVKGYCIDESTRTGLKKAVAAKLKADPQGGGYFTAYETDYVLMTGNNWKGPIGRFHLTLDKLKPDNVLSVCWDGHLKQTSPTTFEDIRENFAPKRDIKLLVVEKRPPGG